jgi:chaperone modulatory protein CbpM
MTLSRQEFMALSGLQQETLTVWLEERWLIPGDTSAGPSFSDIDLARVRLIRTLQHDLGVNDEGVAVILDLIDQLHGMRQVLRQLRQTERSPDPKP